LAFSLFPRICLSFLLLLPGQLLAWGNQGHRIAGALTEPLLQPAARDAVRELIGTQSLAEASTWADRMRGNASPFWQEQAGPYHYVTVPVGKRYSELKPPARGDAVTALAEFSAILRDPDASRVRKQLALRFSLHVIQDLHQPLHVGKGDDRGGNNVKVRVNGETSNLHRVWDSGILRHAGHSDREWVARLSPIDDSLVSSWKDPDPKTWIAESAALRDEIYPATSSLGDGYLARYLPVVERRLQQSAVRAAAWINARLGEEGG
jgi:hypothetical protein